MSSQKDSVISQAERLLARCFKGVRDNTKLTKRPASYREYSKVQDGDVV